MIIIWILMAWASANPCEPPTKTYPLPQDQNMGDYLRVHPKGEFAILSSCTAKTTPFREVDKKTGKKVSSGYSIIGEGACLLDLRKLNTDGTISIIPTKLNDEAYPVEPDWDLVASPNHNNDKEMHYFSLKELTTKPKEQQMPIYKDSFNEFYHSAARTPSGSTRVMMWSNLQHRDYTGASSSMKGGPIKLACSNLLPSNFNYAHFNKVRNDLIAIYQNCADLPEDTPQQSKCYDQVSASPSATEYEKLEVHVKQVLENPILSKNGQEIGGLQGGKLTIYALRNNGNCVTIDQLPFRGSKMSFDHPKSGKKGLIAFTSEGNEVGDLVMSSVYIYDRDSKKLVRIGAGAELSSYPGFTKDGRLMYLKAVNGVRELAIVDLKSFDASKCESYPYTEKPKNPNGVEQ